MAVLENSVPEEIEAVRQRFVAFRSTHPVGSRLRVVPSSGRGLRADRCRSWQ